MSGETAPVFNRMWHLLNVWVGTRESSGRRSNLAKIGVQSVGRGIDQINHVLTVTGQRLLHSTVFKERCDNRILGGQRLKFPVSGRIGNTDTQTFQRFGQLLMRVEVNLI